MSPTFSALEAFLRLAVPLTTQASEGFCLITFPAALLVVAELRLRFERSATVAEHDRGIDGEPGLPPAGGAEEVLALGDFLPGLAVAGIATSEGRQRVPYLLLLLVCASAARELHRPGPSIV